MLTVEGLTFRYPRTKRVLFDDLTFSCPPGTLTAIEGQNGAGKSTLLEICAGLRRPMAGTVKRDGPFAYLPQASTSIVPGLSGVEHIRLFGAACNLSRQAALERATQTVERLGMRPTDLRQQAGRLSGGNRQKLSLALSLMDHRAKLIFLDEPYSGFDAASLLALIDLFADLQAAGHAIVMVNHLTDPRLKIDQFVPIGEAR